MDATATAAWFIVFAIVESALIFSLVTFTALPWWGVGLIAWGVAHVITYVAKQNGSY